MGVVDGRGKVQGTVLTKNRSGAAMRVKVTPINRRTSFQQAARVAFGFFAQGFRALTASQVAAWNAAAASGFISNNIFGNPIKNSGINLYVGLNTNLVTAGVAAISDPPTQGSVSSALTIAPSGDASASELFVNAEFDGAVNAVPANTFLVVAATPPVSNGVTFVKSQLRSIGGIDAAGDTTTTNMASAYSARFGALVTGQKIFIQVVAINKTTGQAGPPLLASFVVVA